MNPQPEAAAPAAPLAGSPPRLAADDVPDWKTPSEPTLIDGVFSLSERKGVLYANGKYVGRLSRKSFRQLEEINRGWWGDVGRHEGRHIAVEVSLGRERNRRTVKRLEIFGSSRGSSPHSSRPWAEAPREY